VLLSLREERGGIKEVKVKKEVLKRSKLKKRQRLRLKKKLKRTVIC